MSSEAKANRRVRANFAVQGETIEDGDDIYAAQVTTPLGDAQTLIREGMASVSEIDTHNKHLQDALVGAAGEITITKLNSSGNEQLQIGINSTYSDNYPGPAGSYERTLFQSGVAAPSAPSAGTVAAGAIPAVPADWSIEPPVTNEPIWVTIQRVARDATEITYTTPRRWNGPRGAAGSFERILFRAADSAPSALDSSSLAAADDTPGVPTSWSIAPPSGNTPIWSTIQRVARDSTTVTYTAPRRWDGLDGPAGSYERVLFKSGTEPAAPTMPNALSHSHDNPTVPDGWSGTPSGDPIWASVQRVARGATAITYTTPTRWDGLDGLAGSYERILFQAAATVPAAPSASVLSDPDAAPAVPASWSADPPSTGMSIWATIQRVARGSKDVTYTTPRRWNGLTGSFERILFQAAATVPAAPSGNILSDPDATPAVPASWSADPPSTGMPIWATIQRVARDSKSVTYTTPRRWDGPAGSYERTVYRALTSAPATPSAPASVANADATPAVPTDWSDTPPTGNTPIWASVQRIDRNSLNVTYTAPRRWDGLDGPSGNFERTIFIASATSPTAPSAPSTVVVDDNPALPGNWLDAPPTSQHPVWASIQRVARGATTVTYTAPSRWNGATGSFERAIFQARATAPSAPSAETLASESDSPTVPSGWAATPPTSANPIWSSVQRVGRGSLAVSYTTPRRWNGLRGAAGSYERTLYRAAENKPDAPAAETLSATDATPAVPDNWADAPPSTDLPIWASVQRVERDSADVTYTDPARWDGPTGPSGGLAGSYERHLYQSAASQPDDLSNDSIANPDDTPSLPADWSLEPPTDDEAIWATIQRVARGSTTVTYTSPRRWSGLDGKAGSFERILFRAANSEPATPSEPSSIDDPADTPLAPANWNTNPPIGTLPIWASIQRVARGGTDVTYTAPVRWSGADGEDGEDGLAGSFERSLYRAQAAQPAAPANSTVATDSTPAVPSNWRTSPPASQHPVWASIQRVARGSTDVTYTTPRRWDGPTGADGLAGSFERILFQAATSAPAAPPNGSLANADDAPAAPSSWSATPPDTNESVYATVQRVARGSTTVTYTDPTRWDGPTGARGLDGGFGLELIGATASSFTIGTQWTDTGIAIPASAQAGEIWAIKVNESLMFFPPDKLYALGTSGGALNIAVANASFVGGSADRYLLIHQLSDVFERIQGNRFYLSMTGGGVVNGLNTVGGNILIVGTTSSRTTGITFYRVKGFSSGRDAHLGSSDVSAGTANTGIVDGRGPFTVPASGDSTERIINFVQHPDKTPAGMEIYASGANKGKFLLPPGKWLVCVGLQLQSSIMDSEVSGVLGIYYDDNLRHPQTIKMSRPENAHRYEGAVSVSGGVVSDGSKLAWIGLSLDTADASNQITLLAGHAHIFEQ